MKSTTTSSEIPILEQAVSAFNAHDAAALERLWTEDAAILVPGGGPLRGGRDWAAYQDVLWRACPDARMELHFAGRVGRAVVQEGTLHGTHTGALALPDGTVVPPTGRAIVVRYVEIFWTDDSERVERVHLYADRLELLEQLGVMERPDREAAR